MVTIDEIKSLGWRGDEIPKNIGEIWLKYGPTVFTFTTHSFRIHKWKLYVDVIGDIQIIRIYALKALQGYDRDKLMIRFYGPVSDLNDLHKQIINSGLDDERREFLINNE